MGQRYKVKMDGIGDWMTRYTREHGGIAHLHIHHKPGCAAEHNTVANLDRVAPKLGQPDALDGVPTCDCGEVEVEVR